jgi:hypothetical protein
MSKSIERAHSSLDRVIELTGLTYDDISDICGSTIKSSADFLALDLSTADKFLEFINIDMSLFFRNSYCPDTLKKQLSGETQIIPDIHIGNGGSTVKTISNALTNTSPLYRDNFLRSHQIHTDFLEDHTNRVSVGVFGEVLSRENARDTSGLGVFSIGATNAVKHIDSIKSEIGEKSNIIESYKSMIENTGVIESNMKYEVTKVVGKTIKVRSTASDHCLSIIKNIKSHQMAFARNIQGFLYGYSKSDRDCNANVRILSAGSRHNHFEVIIN